MNVNPSESEAKAILDKINEIEGSDRGNMKIYIVVTNYMGGIQDGPVFSTRDKAQQYLNSQSDEGSPEIWEQNVIGDMDLPNVVFTANWYDKPSDVHNFEGVYGTHDEAKIASGNQGVVYERKIDERLQ